MLEDVFTIIDVAAAGFICVIVPEIRLSIIERKITSLEANLDKINDNVDKVKKKSLGAWNS